MSTSQPPPIYLSTLSSRPSKWRPASNFHSNGIISNILSVQGSGGDEKKVPRKMLNKPLSRWHFLLWRPLTFLILALQTSPWPSYKWSSAFINIISTSTSGILIKSKTELPKQGKRGGLMLVYSEFFHWATDSSKASAPSAGSSLDEAEWKCFSFSTASLFDWFLLMEVL